MTGVGYDLSTIGVLWRRDLKHFLRQPSRLIGALGQPIIFWLILGSGMASSFHIPGVELAYPKYFFPGVVLMVLFFTSIFSSASVIDDRSHGFFQAVLAGPGSRLAIVLGKSIGACSVAILQAAMMFVLIPFAGFSFAEIQWPLLFVTLLLSSFGLATFSFALAWRLDSMPAYHAIQMTVLVPLWLMSGAVFPLVSSGSVFGKLAWGNPLAYMMSALRQSFSGGHSSIQAVMSFDPLVCLSALLVFAFMGLLLALSVCRRQRF